MLTWCLAHKYDNHFNIWIMGLSHLFVADYPRLADHLVFASAQHVHALLCLVSCSYEKYKMIHNTRYVSNNIPDLQ